MPKHLVSAFASGLLSSGLFLLVSASGLGFIFLFLPALPLFHTGLSLQSRPALHAAFIAAFIITLLGGPAMGILFMLLLGAPVWYITRRLLWSRLDDEGKREWFPVGLAFADLTSYACLAVAAVVLFYAGQPGGMPQILSQQIHTAFSDLQDDYGDVIDQMATTWSFLVFSITIWLWGLALYAHAWLAQRFFIRPEARLRPDLSITPFAMPGWMLFLLLIAALASLIGSPSLAFLGKSTLISLMLPYFFSGSAILHSASKKWPSRRFFLFFVYFFIFAQFWPALILSGIGLWEQIKRLSGHGDWAKR